MMLSFLIISAIKADTACTVNDDLTVTGTTTIGGELWVVGDTALTSDLVVHGDTTLNGLDVIGSVNVSQHCNASQYCDENGIHCHDASDGWDTAAKYCYTYYSTSLVSCTCPPGETNKKDLGTWGVCKYQATHYFDKVFRLPGVSCEDQTSNDGYSYSNTDIGLACVCCEN